MFWTESGCVIIVELKSQSHQKHQDTSVDKMVTDSLMATGQLVLESTGAAYFFQGKL